MAESHVVSGLVAKRSELSGLLAQHQQAIQQLSVSITQTGKSVVSSWGCWENAFGCAAKV
jgi:hypothetical protein